MSTALNRSPVPTPAELAKVEAVALRHNHRALAVLDDDALAAMSERVREAMRQLREEQEQALWDRHEAGAAGDPYFGGQGPRW